MSTHNIGVYEASTKNYISSIIKYHQISNLSLHLGLSSDQRDILVFPYLILLIIVLDMF